MCRCLSSGLESPGGSIRVGHREQERLRSRRLHYVYNGQRVGTQGRQERRPLERAVPPGEGRGSGVWSPAAPLHHGEPIHPVHRSERAGSVWAWAGMTFSHYVNTQQNKMNRCF